MTREIRPATSSADKAKNVHLFSKLLCSLQIAHANFEDVLQQAFCEDSYKRLCFCYTDSKISLLKSQISFS